MVYEEKYVVTNDIPPLQAVGWEGTKTSYYKYLKDNLPKICYILYSCGSLH